MAHLALAPPAGPDFFESDELSFQEPSCNFDSHQREPLEYANATNSKSPHFQPLQYPNYNVRDHCEECCIDPRCLLNNCTECSGHDNDCQQCLEECTDDCTKDPGYVADCNGSKCAYFGSYFASEPCTEPCQGSEIAECTDCHTQIPLDFSLDACFYDCQPSRFDSIGTGQAETKPQNDQALAGNHVAGTPNSQSSSNAFHSPFAAISNNIAYESSSSTLNPYAIAPSHHSGIWEPQPGKTPSLAFTTVTSDKKVPKPLEISSTRHIRSSPETKVTAKTIKSSPFSANEYDPKTASNTSSSPTVASSLSERLNCLWLDDSDQPCNQLFSSSTDLHNHLKTFHHVDEHHLCRWQSCHKGIYSRSPHRFTHGTLRHTWGHSGYRPYICQLCGRGFAAANVLTEHHANVHLQQKQFSCSECGHMCTSASNLKRHFNEKHAAERFQCEWCARAGRVKCFRRGPNLARHFRRCKFVRWECEERGEAQQWMDDRKADVDSEWFPPGYMKGKNGMDRSRVVPPHFMGEDFPAPSRGLEAVSM